MKRVYNDSFVVTFTIDPGPPVTMTKDQDLISYPGGPVVWIVCNNGPNPAYTVEINYAQDIKHNGKAEHPLKGSKMTIDVAEAPAGSHSLAAGVDLIDPDKPHQPKSTEHYDYTVHLFTKPKHDPVTTVDPDLEVVDPFPFVDKKKAKPRKKKTMAGSKRRKSARRR